MKTAAHAFVVDPAVLSADDDTTIASMEDRFAAEHLVHTASATVRDVTRMQVAAAQSGARLLTFTIEADLRFARPDDVYAFTDALAEMIKDRAARYDDPGGRSYRVVIGGHPTPAGD
jgi:hypothetical protein